MSHRTYRIKDNFSDDLVGKRVTLMLRGGNEIRCRVEDVSKYEILVSLEGSEERLIVLKHAIDAIRVQ